MRAAAVSLLAATLTLGLPPARASSEIYRWVDADGRMHVTQHLDEVPAEHRPGASAGDTTRGSVQTFQGPGRSATPAAMAPPGVRSRAAVAGRPVHIPVQRAGTGMVVQVRLNDRVTAPFLIDTGASDVLVPKHVADDLGLRIGPETRTMRYSTANGVVDQPVVMLDAVDLGGARVENVPASVSPSMDVGLLGLSFFNHFTYNVDAAAGILSLTRNDLAESGAIRGGRSEAQWRAEFQNVRGRMAAVETERGWTPTNHSRELRRLDGERVGLERQLDLLEQEADSARVPIPWRD